MALGAHTKGAVKQYETVQYIVKKDSVRTLWQSVVSTHNYVRPGRGNGENLSKPRGRDLDAYINVSMDTYVFVNM